MRLQQIVLMAAFLVTLAAVSAVAQRAATQADRILAQMAIAKDGQTVTFRGAAPDSLRVCVEPKAGTFGPTRCYTVGQIRAGGVR